MTDLGLSDGSISDSQITASNEKGSYPAVGVRLGTGNAWETKSTDIYPWLQVDFLNVVNIAIVKTQGAITRVNFVRTFSVSFGHDGVNFEDYQNGGRKKVLINHSNNLVGHCRLMNVFLKAFRHH